MNLDKIIEKRVEEIIESRVESVLEKMFLSGTEKKIISSPIKKKERNPYSKDSMAHEVYINLNENGKVRITRLIRETGFGERQIRDVLYRLERNGHANYHTKKGYAWPT